ARPPSASYRISKFIQKNRGLVAALGAIVALLVVAVCVSSWFAKLASENAERFKRERDRANSERDAAVVVLDFFEHDLLEPANPFQDAFVPQSLPGILSQSSPRILTRFQEYPFQRASLNAVVGKLFAQLGETKEAVAHLGIASQLYSNLGIDDVRTNNVKAQLAMMLASEHKFDNALNELELVLNKEKDGGDQVEIFGTKISIATVYFEKYLAQGRKDDLKKSEELFIEIENGLLDDEGINQLLTLQVKYNLGVIFLEEQNLISAQKKVRESLNLANSHLQKDHPFRLRILTSAAVLDRANGRPKDSIEKLDEVFNSQLKILDAGHLDLLSTKLEIAFSLNAVGEPDRGLDVLLKGLDSHVARYGFENAQCSEALAWIFKNAPYTQSIGITQSLIDINSDEVCVIMARLHFSREETASAMRWLERIADDDCQKQVELLRMKLASGILRPDVIFRGFEANLQQELTSWQKNLVNLLRIKYDQTPTPKATRTVYKIYNRFLENIKASPPWRLDDFFDCGEVLSSRIENEEEFPLSLEDFRSRFEDAKKLLQTNGSDTNM
ncbi:hypothetical protein N9Y42_03055, partial [Mariniblastus sp.]|nr:hypothetical protein [Mariniblastus sp.]